MTLLFIVRASIYRCLGISAEGALLALGLITLWEYGICTALEYRPTFWQMLLGILATSLIGGVILGTPVSLAFAAVYLSQRYVPITLHKIAPRMSLPYLSSRKSAPWEYRGDKRVAIYAGIVLGSANVPVGYLVLRYFGWELNEVPHDPIRPALAAMVGVLLSAIMRAEGGKQRRAEEKKLAEEAAKAANSVMKAKSTAEEQILEKNPVM